MLDDETLSTTLPTLPTGATGATGAWEQAHRRSLTDPDSFWREAAAGVEWDTEPVRVLDDDAAPLYRWFTGGVLNTCFNALDRHVRDGRGAQPALVHDSPVTGTVTTLTYDELLDEVARFAGVLRGLGVRQGDRVVVYLPMVPLAAVTMLACARLGAVHSVVFGGFAPTELAARIDDARPVVVVTASCGIEPTRVVAYKPMLDAALAKAAHRPAHVVVLQRPQLHADMTPGRDLDHDALMADAEPVGCVPVQATDPLYVLYTSGTTGRPKGIVRDNGGHAVALTWAVQNVFGVRPGETMFTASDVGWVVGHSFIVYAPLLVGATTVLFEGKPVGTPDASAFWRVVEQHRVTVMFTAPTAIRAIKKVDPMGRLARGRDTSSLRTLFLAGERLDPDTYHWAGDVLGVPVVDNWWQTETGWPIAASCRGLEELPIKPGSPSVPVPGYDVAVLDGYGQPVPPGTEGAICLRLPMPPGTLPTLWGDDQRYVDGYLSTFPGYYLTGDGGYLDEDGYLFVMGRTDDVINVAGHRLSTGGIEAALAGHPAVAECAVIGVHDDVKGQVPRALVVLKGGSDDLDRDVLVGELRALVRGEVGAIASLHRVDVVQALPKTRSGKILRRTMREIADGKRPAVPSTIEDVGVLQDVEALLRG